MIAVLSGLGLTCASVLLFVRFLRGPSVFDRLLAVYGLFLCAALMAATVAARDVRWIDAAVALVLFGAVLVIASVKVLRKQGFPSPLAALDDGAGG